MVCLPIGIRGAGWPGLERLPHRFSDIARGRGTWMTMARTYITDGSGFVGKQLVATLRARGDEVRMPDPAAAGGPSELIKGMAGCHVVFHTAGRTSDWGRPDEFNRANLLATEQVIVAARSAGVRKLVKLSSASVLLSQAEAPVVLADETVPLPAEPIGPQSETLGKAEQLVLAANSAELGTVVIRPAWLWGRDEPQHLPRMVLAAREGRFRWVEEAEHLVSTCHVANLCEGLRLAAERGRCGELYHVTDGKPIVFRTFMTALLQTQGLEPPERRISRRRAGAIARLSDLAWRTVPMLAARGAPPLTPAGLRLVGTELTLADAKIRQELGYEPVTSRAEGYAALRLAVEDSTADQIEGLYA